MRTAVSAATSGLGRSGRARPPGSAEPDRQCSDHAGEHRGVVDPDARERLRVEPQQPEDRRRDLRRGDVRPDDTALHARAGHDERHVPVRRGVAAVLRDLADLARVDDAVLRDPDQVGRVRVTRLRVDEAVRRRAGQHPGQPRRLHGRRERALGVGHEVRGRGVRQQGVRRVGAGSSRPIREPHQHHVVVDREVHERLRARVGARPSGVQRIDDRPVVDAAEGRRRDRATGRASRTGRSSCSPRGGAGGSPGASAPPRRRRSRARASAAARACRHWCTRP